MLKLLIISVLLLLGFVAAAWYAYRRTKRRSNAFKLKARIVEPEVEPEFSHYLNEQLNRQQHSLGSVDEVALAQALAEEPKLTLSSDTAMVGESRFDALIETENTTSAPDHVELTVNDSEKSGQEQIGSKPAIKHKEWDIVLALTIMADEQQHFSGQDIAAALKSVDMTAGEMHIFHRYSAQKGKHTLFSIANILAPGTLTLTELPTLQTQGLVIFMQLPSQANSLLVFDAMLAAADKIAKHLNGQLRDEHRHTLTEATLEKMRSRILTFNLTQQLEQHSF